MPKLSRNKKSRARRSSQRKSKTQSRRRAQIRKRAQRVLTRIIRGQSPTAAARAEHISLQASLKHIGKYLRRKRTKGGRIRYVPIKPKRRIAVWLLTSRGYIPVSVTPRDASILGKHSSRIRKFLRTGDVSGLQKLAGKRIAGHELIVDPQVLTTRARAGALRLDDLYV